MLQASSAPPLVANRLRAVLLHVPYYSQESLSRLAEDTHLSIASIFRYATQQANPTRPIASIIASALSKRSGVKIRAREIFSKDGTYPTPSVCALCGCGGCLPPEAWDEETDTIRPEWRHAKPGEWSRFEPDPSSPGETHLIDIS